jgi:hypothetical protein
MAHPFKSPAVQAIEDLARSVEQQWIVAGLGPCAMPDEVLRRAIVALHQAQPAPEGIVDAAESLRRSQLPLIRPSAAPKREARMRAAAVKIYRTEHRRISRQEGSGKLSEISRKISAVAWEKTQTELLHKFEIKAPDLWKYEIFPSVEK